MSLDSSVWDIILGVLILWALFFLAIVVIVFLLTLVSGNDEVN